MKRTFIAFDVEPDAITKAVFNTVREKLGKERITWVQPDHFHVTLKFLGNTVEEQIHFIKEALEQTVANFSSFRIKLQGLGVFKNIHDPRVIWIGCQVEKTLAGMREMIDSKMNLLGFEKEERPFAPHLTLGRIKQMRHTDHLNELITAYKDTIFQESLIKEIIYYESRLSSLGPVYTVIEKFRVLPSQS